MDKKQTNNEKHKINLKNINWKSISKDIAYWVFFIILVVFFNYAKFNSEARNDAYFYFNIIEEQRAAFVLWFVFALVLNIILHVIKNKKLELHQIFIVIAVFLGICFGIIIPLGQGSDETSHFIRIYEISRKYTTLNYEESTEFPRAFELLGDYQSQKEISYKQYIENYDEFLMNSNDKVDLKGKYWNTKLYSPIQYLPQVIGVTLGRVFSDNILVIGTLGRIFGFIAWVTACAYAIKIIPNKKIFILILCLLPINIFSAVCLSGDTLTNAVTVLFIAIIYRKVYLHEEVKIKDKIILLVLGALIALCKIVYLPIIFLVCLLSKDLFKNKKVWISFNISLIILSCIVGLTWLTIGSGSLSDSNPASKEQVEYIFEDPIRYCLITMDTFMVRGVAYINQFMTGDDIACQGRARIYPIISYIIGAVVLISLFLDEDNDDIKMSVLQKWIVGLVILGTCALICTALYVQWTSLFTIGGGMIEGIQGRYFIPVAMILIFISTSIKISIKNKENLITFLSVIQLPIMGLIISSFI